MTDSEQVKCDIEYFDNNSYTKSRQMDNKDSPSVEVNSSILEYLELERKCLSSGGGDGTEVDVTTIFDEIKKLSSDFSPSGAGCDEAGDRSIEDIIKEAQRLMNESSGGSLESCQKSSRSINNNGQHEEKCTMDCDKRNGSDNLELDVKESHDKSVSYDDSFDTVSDVKSLPEDDDDKVFDDEEEDNEILSSDRTFLRRLTQSPVSLKADILGDVSEVIKKQQLIDLEPIVVESSPDFTDSLQMRKKYKKKSPGRSCDAATSPTRFDSGEVSPVHQDLNLKRPDDYIKDLEERLKAAKLQYNNVAVSFRSLTQEHAALETKCYGLQAEVQRLQDVLKATNIQQEKQKEISDRLNNTNMKLQSQLENERAARKSLVAIDEDQKKTILDLQRQIREMDRILSKKYPDSVSALIVASKTPTVEANESARRFLEERIEQLESNSKTQTAQSQCVLLGVKAKFSEMQLKYEAHISDLEAQVFHLQQINADFQHKEQQLKTSKVTRDQDCQTEQMVTKSQQSSAKTKKNCNTVGVQTARVASKQPLTKPSKQVIALAANREESHLMASIRGLKQELAAKEKAMHKVTKELEDCKKTIKRLQKDREANLKEEMQNSVKEYDPQAFTETAKHEQEMIQNRAFQLLQREYQSLVEKRLQDLATLQNTHERELTNLDQTILTLHNRIREKDSTIASLKGQIKNKVTALEKRQMEREKTLQTIVSKLSNGKHDKDWINM